MFAFGGPTRLHAVPGRSASLIHTRDVVIPSCFVTKGPTHTLYENKSLRSVRS